MRNTEDAWVAGVCAGLADHWDTDPMLVRVLTVALSIAVGVVPLVYVLLGFFAPAEPLAPGVESQERRWLLWLMALVMLLPFFAIGAMIMLVITNIIFFQEF